ncbi:MAG: protein translocase subunit SecD, partial [Syntrophorhabdales bacterium]
MLKSLKFRAILVVVFLVIFAVFLVPNFVDLKGAWKRYLPSDKIRLGLDLKGGMHLLLAMDTSKMMENMTDRKFTGLKDGMIREGVRFLNLERKGEF